MKYTLRAVKVAKDGTTEVEDDELILNAFYHPQTGELMIAILIPVEEREKKAEEEKEKKAEEKKAEEDKE